MAGSLEDRVNRDIGDVLDKAESKPSFSIGSDFSMDIQTPRRIDALRGRLGCLGCLLIVTAAAGVLLTPPGLIVGGILSKQPEMVILGVGLEVTEAIGAGLTLRWAYKRYFTGKPLYN